MKRILSACLEQTQRFESEGDYQTYLKGLERKKIQYKILDKVSQPGGFITVKLIRDYNNYPVGEYMN